MTLEQVEELRDQASEIYDSLEIESVCTVEAEFYDKEEWPIADWKVEDEIEDIASHKIVAEVTVEADGKEKSTVNSLLTKEIEKVIAKLNELGYTAEENTEKNRNGGGGSVKLIITKL